MRIGIALPEMLRLDVLADIIHRGDAPYAVFNRHVEVWNTQVIAGDIALLKRHLKQPTPKDNGKPLWVKAFLAGLIEHESMLMDVPAPDWVNHRDSFLVTPHFLTVSAAFREIALVETPSSFRRRLIFCGEVGLLAKS